jgi:hypothetical protein
MVVTTASLPELLGAGKECKCVESDRSDWLLVLESQQIMSCYLDMNISVQEHTVM